MITGAYVVGPVVEESACRSSEETRFTDIGIYKIHSNVLMSEIPFEEAKKIPEPIDSTIFINDKDTELTFESIIQTQNYITTRYIGRAPLEFYSSGSTTEVGREFVLVCREGNTKDDFRVFGTEDAINGYNKNASDSSYHSR